MTDQAMQKDIDRHERQIESLWSGKASLKDLDGLGKDVAELAVEVKSLRRTIVVFAFTIAGSSITIASAVLVAVGGNG